jgi:hypothetical protein
VGVPPCRAARRENPTCGRPFGSTTQGSNRAGGAKGRPPHRRGRPNAPPRMLARRSSHSVSTHPSICAMSAAAASSNAEVSPAPAHRAKQRFGYSYDSPCPRNFGVSAYSPARESGVISLFVQPLHFDRSEPGCRSEIQRRVAVRGMTASVRLKQGGHRTAEGRHRTQPVFEVSSVRLIERVHRPVMQQSESVLTFGRRLTTTFDPSRVSPWSNATRCRHSMTGGHRLRGRFRVNVEPRALIGLG